MANPFLNLTTAIWTAKQIVPPQRLQQLMGQDWGIVEGPISFQGKEQNHGAELTIAQGWVTHGGIDIRINFPALQKDDPKWGDLDVTFGLGFEVANDDLLGTVTFKCRLNINSPTSTTISRNEVQITTDDARVRTDLRVTKRGYPEAHHRLAIQFRKIAGPFFRPIWRGWLGARSYIQVDGEADR